MFARLEKSFPAESHWLVPRSTHVLGPWSSLLSLTVPWTHGLVWITDQFSVQVTILQKPVLECKTFLFPLSPFLIVKVDVSALKKGRNCSLLLSYLSLRTCSYSSLIILGSSCLWNHIMYLVWNLQLCFLRALAARYWALVPSM